MVLRRGPARRATGALGARGHGPPAGKECPDRASRHPAVCPDSASPGRPAVLRRSRTLRRPRRGPRGLGQRSLDQAGSGCQVSGRGGVSNGLDSYPPTGSGTGMLGSWGDATGCGVERPVGVCSCPTRSAPLWTRHWPPCGPLDHGTVAPPIVWEFRTVKTSREPPRTPWPGLIPRSLPSRARGYSSVTSLPCPEDGTRRDDRLSRASALAARRGGAVVPTFHRVRARAGQPRPRCRTVVPSQIDADGGGSQAGRRGWWKGPRS